MRPLQGVFAVPCVSRDDPMGAVSLSMMDLALDNATALYLLLPCREWKIKFCDRSFCDAFIWLTGAFFPSPSSCFA